MRLRVLLGVVMLSCSPGSFKPGLNSDIPPISVEVPCRVDHDCLPGLSCNILKNRCENPSLCWNGIRDRDNCQSSPYLCSSETGLDCGGGLCSPCVPGSYCTQDPDCISESCREHVCEHFLPCTEFLLIGPLEPRIFELIFYDQAGRRWYQSSLDSVCLTQLSLACEIEVRCKQEGEDGRCNKVPSIYLVRQGNPSGVFGFEEIKPGKYRARIGGRMLKYPGEISTCGVGACRYCGLEEWCRIDEDCAPPLVCRGWCRENRGKD